MVRERKKLELKNPVIVVNQTNFKVKMINKLWFWKPCTTKNPEGDEKLG